MSKLKYILVIILTTIIVTSLKSQNVKVKCVNRTGFDLDSLVMQSAFIGQLQNDSTSQIIKFNEIIIDSGTIPVTTLKSNINSRPITQTKMAYECATSWKRITEGFYIIYIYYNNTAEEEYLWLSLSEKK